MATPGELVRGVAETLGIPEPTVTQHDRNLVLSCLRTKGGRGRNAAKVTAQDAAHLLVGILGSDQVKDTESAVRRYQETVSLRMSESSPPWHEHVIPELASLEPDHSFIDVLTALLSAAENGTLLFRLKPPLKHSQSKTTPQLIPTIEVAVRSPSSLGSIRVLESNKKETRATYLPTWESIQKGHEPRRHKIRLENHDLTEDDMYDDYTQERRLSLRVLLRIGEVLGA